MAEEGGPGRCLRRAGWGRRPCPGGVAAVRALCSHWRRTRKSLWRLRSEAAALPRSLRRWRRRRGGGRGSRSGRTGSRTMVGRCCHDPCQDSPTGWTYGSSSFLTWRFSCLSTCCPEGAAQVRSAVRGRAVRLSVGRSVCLSVPHGGKGPLQELVPGNSPGIPTAPPQKASGAQILSGNWKLVPNHPQLCLFRNLLADLCSGGVAEAPSLSVSSPGLCSTTNITRPALFPAGPLPPREFSPISHLMNTGDGRGGPFVQDKELGTRLHWRLDGGGTFLYPTVIDRCVAQVFLFSFYLHPVPGS